MRLSLSSLVSPGRTVILQLAAFTRRMAACISWHHSVYSTRAVFFPGLRRTHRGAIRGADGGIAAEGAIGDYVPGGHDRLLEGADEAVGAVLRRTDAEVLGATGTHQTSLRQGSRGGIGSLRTDDRLGWLLGAKPTSLSGQSLSLRSKTGHLSDEAAEAEPR